MERPRNRAMRFLTADWRDLAMLNYEIGPEILAPRVPNGTELDSWGGRAFVSVVGFRFLDTRVIGVPVPYHVNFDEATLNCDVASLYGDEFADPLSSAPATAFVAEGSPVLVRCGRRF